MINVIAPVVLVLVVCILPLVVLSLREKTGAYVRSVNARHDWESLALGIGDRNIERAWLRTAKQMFQTFARKNHDYGTGNASAGGVVGIALRLGDKVSRLWQLTGLHGGDQASAVGETLEDTFLDIANYAIIGAMMVKGDWPMDKTISGLIGRDAMATILMSSLQDLDEDTVAALGAAWRANELLAEIGRAE